MQITSGDIETLHPRLRARARRLTATRSEAEDLCQETLLRLWQAAQDHREIDKPGRYAMIVLHNLARTQWRKRVTLVALDETMLQARPDGPGRLACAALALAIETLPEGQAALMRRVAAGETSPAALAREMNLPPGTVMSRLARARKRLRAQMGLAADAPVSELL